MDDVNTYLAAAALLAFLVGLAHSVLGELLIFRRLRHDGLIPTLGGDRLQERHVRILWASWHVLTLFGWAMAAILMWRAQQPAAVADGLAFVDQAIALAMMAGALCVAVGTKARHPGWIGLSGVAVLIWLAHAG